jgi:hypothetical protein
MTTIAFLLIVLLVVFVLGVWTGREIYRPRVDFHRYELPAKSRHL